MPSSSNRDTVQETDLYSCWRIAYIRLYTVHARDDADSITRAFAAILDVSYNDLISFWPPGPKGREHEVAAGERRIYQAVKAAGMKLSTVEKIEQAASACVEASEYLVRYGRGAEAEGLEEMGKDLHALAERLPNRKSRWDRGDEDHEMEEA